MSYIADMVVFRSAVFGMQITKRQANEKKRPLILISYCTG